MKNLIIIGAGGFGREVYSNARACQESDSTLVIKGFLDDDNDSLLGYENYPPILSSIEEYVVDPDDVFICSLGNPQTKKKCISIIKQKGGKFINLIHPQVHIGDNVKLGEGILVLCNSLIGQDATIGDYVSFDGFSTIGHDCVIGSYSHIGACSSIAGGTKIGDCTLIHPGARVAPHRVIGDNSIIGIGSVVISNVKPYTTVFGNPAKKVEF